MEGLSAQDILETVYGPGCGDGVVEIVVITKGSCYSPHSNGKSETPIFWPFEQGEIVFLDSSGREPFNEGRKPDKWDVEAVSCSTLTEARELSMHVKAAPPLFMPDYRKSRAPEKWER